MLAAGMSDQQQPSSNTTAAAGNSPYGDPLGDNFDVDRYLEDTLKKRIMYLDGAMGTMIQKLRLEEHHFRGKLPSPSSSRKSMPLTHAHFILPYSH